MDSDLRGGPNCETVRIDSVGRLSGHSLQSSLLAEKAPRMALSRTTPVFHLFTKASAPDRPLAPCPCMYMSVPSWQPDSHSRLAFSSPQQDGIYPLLD